MSIKLLQVNTFYPEYIEYHYQKYPDLHCQSYTKQIQSLLKDGFSSGNILAPYLSKNDYSSVLVIANNQYSQERWLQENQLNISNFKKCCIETVQIQVEKIRPDILYIADPIQFDHSFIKQLKWKPKLIIGWRSSTIKQTTDWCGFDIILSHLTYCLKKARLIGASSSKYFLPGFSRSIIKQIKCDKKKWDFIFTGHAMPLHKRRNKYLLELANNFKYESETASAYFIGHRKNELPANLPVNILGPLWGIEMYQEIQRAKIVLNADIDLAQEAGNFRLFEVTGIGSFILTEFHPNIVKIFKPGVEIETFRDTNELIAKVKYYLAHPAERESIARKGQERCFKEHLIENRIKKFDKIISKHRKMENK